MKVEQALIETCVAMRLFGDDQQAAWQNRKGTQVKRFVMQATKRESVLFFIRPARLMPFDVRCFQTYHLISESDIKSADSACVLIRCQDSLAKRRISFAAGNGLREAWVESYRIKNVLMQTRGEMCIQQTERHIGDQLWIMLEGICDLRGEACVDVFVEQFAFRNICLSSSPCECIAVVHVPHPVILESPEWILRMPRLARRSIFFQQTRQLRSNGSKCEGVRRATRKDTKCVQDKQGFVRSALRPAGPHVNAGKCLQDVILRQHGEDDFTEKQGRRMLSTSKIKLRLGELSQKQIEQNASLVQNARRSWNRGRTNVTLCEILPV